jgi:hypothetical protein
MWADRLRNRTESQCRYWQGNPARPARSARARSEGCALHDSTRRTPDKATHSQAHPHGVAGAAAVFVPGGAGKQCEPLLSFRTQGVALPLAYGRPDHGNVRLLWEYARPRIALLRGTRPHRVSTQHPELCAKYSNDEYGPLAEVCSVGTPRHTFGVVSGSGWGPLIASAIPTLGGVRELAAARTPYHARSVGPPYAPVGCAARCVATGAPSHGTSYLHSCPPRRVPVSHRRRTPAPAPLPRLRRLALLACSGPT